MTKPAEDAPLIPREALFGNPSKAQGRVSPDGQWLSWLAPKDGVLMLRLSAPPVREGETLLLVGSVRPAD